MAAKVEISCSAASTIRRIGLCPEKVVQAVQAPDNVEKIMPGGGDERDWPIVSLYVKRFFDSTGESLLLVQGLKVGGTVMASAVWQIYPETIGVSESTRAFDVFRAFLDKYGVDLKTASGLTKFITHQVVGSSTTTRHGRWERSFRLPEGVLAAEDCRVTDTPEVCSNKWARELNIKMHVALLYSINLSNYFHDLTVRRCAAKPQLAQHALCESF